MQARGISAVLDRNHQLPRGWVPAWTPPPPLVPLEVVEDGGVGGRERPLPKGGGQMHYLLILQMEGSSVIHQLREHAFVETDSLLLLNAAVPARMKVFGRARQLCLHLPSPLIGKLAGRSLPALGVISGKVGIGASLRSLVLSMRSVAPALTAEEQWGLRAALCDLALAAWPGEGGGVAGSGRRAEAAMRSVAPLHATIEHWLADPDLCPAKVAAVHGISIRQLHRLFKVTGVPFSAFVRRRRLERCRADLADPKLTTLRMTEIAYRWGFSDSAHFSRCFRAAFGCTARDFRAGRLHRGRIGRGPQG